MAKQGTTIARRVVESLGQFDLSRTPFSSTITCLSIGLLSNSTLSIYAGTDRGSLLLLTLDTIPDQSSPLTENNEKVKLTQHVSISQFAVTSVHAFACIGKGLAISDGNLYLFDLDAVDNVRKLSSFRGVCGVARRVCSSDGGTGTGTGTGLSFVFDEVESENWSSNSMGGRIMKRLGGGGKASGGKVKELGSSVERNDDDDNSSAKCVFAVAMTKKLVFVELYSKDAEGQRGSFVVLKELPCIESVKALAWLDESIFLGTTSGYSLMSCVTGHLSLIFSLPDTVTSPCLKVLSKDKKVLLMVDNAGVIVDSHGQPVGGTLVFHHAPDSVAELPAYVVVAGDGKMELYHRRSGDCVQALSFGGSFQQKKCFLADQEDGRGRFVAAGVSCKIFCHWMLPYEEQVRDLLRKKNFNEAIILTEELEADGDISQEMTSFVHAQVGFLLLFDLHFEEAVDHFLLSETMQPSEIFPFVIRDPNRWSLLVPRNRYWGLHPPPAHIEDVVDDGLLAIQRAAFLKKAGVETAVDGQFLLKPPSKAVLLESAFRNIIRYLQATRVKDLNLPVMEGVDTLLMYLYRSLNCHEDMEKLASSENSCVVEELETLLEESGHLRTLAFLHANKGRYSSALAIWRVLARNYPSDLNQESSDAHNLDDTYLMGVYSKESAAVEASKILEESDDDGLVLQHLGWVSEISEELAVQILTSPKRISVLPPDTVIAAIDPRKIQILQRYLQWLIEDQDSSDSQFHTLYALSLARSAFDSMEMENFVQLTEANKCSVRRTEKFVQLAEANKCSVMRNPQRDSLARERLQIFLHSSDLYDIDAVLELIEGSELWLEKAILYRKLGHEALVLQILALKLEDSEAAEQYCAELGRADAYMQLLDMYLDPKNGKQPMFKAAVRLLHNHGESLDPLQVLERLSPDMPLKLASETILRMLRARLHHHHQGKIVHSLSRAVDVDARLARLDERSRFVQINDESLCDSCRARLGTKLFAMYPDDSIVCYKCFRRQGESTSVNGRNFKKDMLIKPGWLVSR